MIFTQTNAVTSSFFFRNSISRKDVENEAKPAKRRVYEGKEKKDAAIMKILGKTVMGVVK